MEPRKLLHLSLSIIFAVTGYSHAQHQWTAEHITTISGFNVPECALYVPDRGLVYVSNVESAPDEYWTDDGKGYVSVLGDDHHIAIERWVNSESEFKPGAGTGICKQSRHTSFCTNCDAGQTTGF